MPIAKEKIAKVVNAAHIKNSRAEELKKARAEKRQKATEAIEKRREALKEKREAAKQSYKEKAEKRRSGKKVAKAPVKPAKPVKSKKFAKPKDIKARLKNNAKFVAYEKANRFDIAEHYAKEKKAKNVPKGQDYTEFAWHHYLDYMKAKRNDERQKKVVEKPKPEPKPTPRPEPKPEPKSEPKPAPKASKADDDQEARGKEAGDLMAQILKNLEN